MKPLYSDLRQALLDMRLQAINYDINVIAMPRICCGYDRLEWEKVKNLIQDVFDDTEITIIVVINSEGAMRQ